jgi:hypothetical protein
MFIEAIQYRILEFNRLKTLKQQNEMNCPIELNEAIKANITAISLLVVIFLILFILSIYYTFKCAIVKGWSMFVPILILFAMLLPSYGGLVMIGMIVYGMNSCGSICDMPADLRKKFGN